MARGGYKAVKFKSYLPRVEDILEEELDKRLTAATLLWVGGIRREMTGDKSGAWYPIPGTKVKYQASAPGEAPAVREGILRASYQNDVDRENWIGYVGSDLDYSLHLERGTWKMEPRPAIKPAFMKLKATITQILTEGIK